MDTKVRFVFFRCFPEFLKFAVFKSLQQPDSTLKVPLGRGRKCLFKMPIRTKDRTDVLVPGEHEIVMEGLRGFRIIQWFLDSQWDRETCVSDLP